ncbi:MAG: CBS domain-containing protein [Streptosporangiaceae bacterium]|jgi:CBS domain-containing protein
MNGTVKDVMTAEVVAVRRDTTFKELAATLRQYRVSAFPVVDDAGRVIGLVSEADMLAKEALAEPGVVAGLLQHKDVRQAEAVTAGALMTHQVVTVSPGDSIEQAARMMHFLKVRQLPVVNSGGELVGIVSRSDLLSVFDRPDEDIRKDVTDTMFRHEFLIDPRQFKVTVEAGVVTLEGTPETAALGRDLVRKARHVQGVVAVRDRLSYPDDYRVAAGPVL